MRDAVADIPARHMPTLNRDAELLVSLGFERAPARSTRSQRSRPTMPLTWLTTNLLSPRVGTGAAYRLTVRQIAFHGVWMIGLAVVATVVFDWPFFVPILFGVVWAALGFYVYRNAREAFESALANRASQ